MMIRERAEIIAMHDDYLTVSTELKSGCGGCAQQNSCGAGIISKAFADRRAQFIVQRPAGLTLAVGEQVELALPQAMLTRFSLWVYGAPLLVLLLVALMGQLMLGWSEGYVIISALVSFGFSFVLIRQWLKLRDVQVSQLLQIQQIS
jgi:sigma-E factor negative regulatory protein RseC